MDTLGSRAGRIGVPGQGASPGRTTEGPAVGPLGGLENDRRPGDEAIGPAAPDVWSRSGDTGLGRPSHPLVASSALTAEEFQAAEACDPAWNDEVATYEGAGPVVFDGWGLLRGSMAGFFLLAVCCALILFITSQVTSMIAALAVLPDWARFLGYAGLGVLTGAVAFAFAGLAWSYTRLRRNRQVRLASLGDLKARRKLHAMARTEVDLAVRQIQKYVQDSDFSLTDDRAGWLALGFDGASLDSLARSRRDLLDSDKSKGNSAWLKSYQAEFQDILDRVARARVDRFARLAAVKTSISPNALIDTLVVAYLCFTMMRDLCNIYRLRLGAIDTANTLAHLFFTTYVSGGINDLEGGVSDNIQAMLHNSGELVGFAASKIAAKGAAAVLNYALIRRLGRSAVRLLQPLESA